MNTNLVSTECHNFAAYIDSIILRKNSAMISVEPFKVIAAFWSVPAIFLAIALLWPLILLCLLRLTHALFHSSRRSLITRSTQVTANSSPDGRGTNSRCLRREVVEGVTATVCCIYKIIKNCQVDLEYVYLLQMRLTVASLPVRSWEKSISTISIYRMTMACHYSMM